MLNDFQIVDVKRTYDEIASKMVEKFAHVYKHAARVVRNVNVDPTMPRVAGYQIHRCNAPAERPEQYYQRNVAVPLVNHIKAELEEQFSGNEFSG